eukprot:7342885-Alexandrium_andersonii.AAC.1
MSASLVGSEMCIRDRAWGSRVLRSVRLQGFREDRWVACLKILGKTPGAVSYTHLTLPTICSV